MGNRLIEQCTGDDNKIEGFHGDMSAIIVNHSPSKVEIEAAESLPSRSKEVQQTYQLLLSERGIDYTLEGQKSTFHPIRLTIFDEGGVYIGWTKNDRPHGPGQLYFDNHKYLQAIFKEGEVDCDDGLFIEPTGDYYRGGFRKSLQSGFGTLRKKEETIVGRFQNGAADGKGEKLFSDGRIFRGYFKNGKMEGKGTLTLPNSHQYCGYFRDDVREGVGKLKTPQYEYFGPYKGDKKEGKGTVIFSDGSKFEGWLQGDRIEGYGEWHSPNGTVEKGNYSRSLPA